MKILSVDDSAIIRKIIRMAVEVIEYEFMEAADGEEALKVIEQEYKEIALILLDWNMPGIDGFELLKKLKEEDRFKHIPVMMVTTESEKLNIIKAIQAGAIHYVIKPFTMEEVTKKMLEALGRGE
ncbi:response regulator [Clostridium ganghwense]|uniref:Stage 0 sporulation protein A homolog n=1 Tax=Clostridium ganghwense TaxID=312089 RepID=A0ABT4CLJ4_9CLOT|nr:response regulator [Clostridium ganghwense]MCY6369915.1 response regulator [Clostridium ganghwense]